MQKLLTFFFSKNIRVLYIESAKTVNEMILNELVKLTTLSTTGPWSIATPKNYTGKLYGKKGPYAIYEQRKRIRAAV